MSLAKVYSYAVGAGGSFTLPGGRFFRVVRADTDITVEMFSDAGEPLGAFENVRAGLSFGVEPSDIEKTSRLVGFAKLKITSAAAQTITVLVSRQPIEYDNVASSVVVSSITNSTAAVPVGLDALTAANQAFASCASSGPLVGLLATVQLWNPAASGKIVFVDRVHVSSNGTPSDIAIGLTNVQIATYLQNGQNKNNVVPTSGVAELYQEGRAAFLGTKLWQSDYAYEPIEAVFSPPVRLPAGTGLIVVALLGNMNVQAAYQWREL